MPPIDKPSRSFPESNVANREAQHRVRQESFAMIPTADLPQPQPLDTMTIIMITKSWNSPHRLSALQTLHFLLIALSFSASHFLHWSPKN